MGTKDALMLARLRTVRDREGDPTDPGATRVQLEPKTHRGRNTHGVTAAPNDGFSSLVEIRHETPVITPLAHAVQSGFNKVLGMVMHNDATVSATLSRLYVVHRTGVCGLLSSVVQTSHTAVGSLLLHTCIS